MSIFKKLSEVRMWRLHNCMTAHIKDLKPAPAFTANLKLTRFFEKVG
jgi:hypothetical protein